VHPALLKLIRFQIRGWVRRQLGGGSVRRTVFTIVGLAGFALWITSLALTSTLQPVRTPEETLATLPLYLTALALLPVLFSGEDRALAFTPAEVDFLFPGPFSRRALVLYKLVKLVLASALSGLIFGMVFKSFAGSLANAVLGAVLVLTFVNLLATLLALVRDVVTERWYRLARWTAMAGIAAAAGAIAWMVRTGNIPTAAAVERVAGSDTGRVVLAPARVFAHVIAEPTLLGATPWVLVCLGMIGAAGGAVLAMDGRYLEAAVEASRRWHERLSRAQRGITLVSGRPTRRFALPELGVFGPARAIVRRHLITAVRGSRGWLLAALFAAVYGYLMTRMSGMNAAGPATLVPGAVLISVFLPQVLRFDFRADLEHMDTLKALPLRPGAVAIAEIAVPTAMLVMMSWIVAAAAGAFAGLPWRTAVMAGAGAVPVAAALMALENLVFLLVPTRTHHQAGAVFSGRRAIMVLARMACMFIGGGTVAAFGGIAWVLTRSPGAVFAVCWIATGGIAAALVWAVAAVYQRFDISRDMPA
jgi:hypothetical protein